MKYCPRAFKLSTGGPDKLRILICNRRPELGKGGAYQKHITRSGRSIVESINI